MIYSTHIRVAVLVLINVAFSLTSSAQDGENLYKANCASCHKITDQRLVGPGLAGVETRWEEKDNLVAWITNSQKYLKDNPGDKYAHDLFEAYNKSVMPPMPLSVDEINAVLDYIANPPVKDVPVAATPTAATTVESGEDYTMYWLLGALVVFLILIKILTDVKKSLNNLILIKAGKGDSIQEEEDLELNIFERISIWAQNNKKYVAVLIIGLAGFGATKGWYALKGIGVYEGYSPTQPIKFSHKIHAGENAISCQYCHNSVEKSKSAGIPSVNICMNCHAGIQEGKRWGKEEIAKIFAASGYDPSTASYSNPEKPIEWIRIHNLPDHVYFNHSQHVVVGKQECTTCHGDVANIDYPMKQHAPLTMGWCIDCHRQTNVAMEGNGYYDEVHKELQEIYSSEGIEDFKVQHIGGLECSKCHY